MKVSSFYLTDISEYDNFITKIVNDIKYNFYGKGVNSITISKLISYLRTELTGYASLKFGKNTIVLVNLPRVDRYLIEKTVENDKDKIKIRLNYDKIKNILCGNYDEYYEYIEEIITQFEDYLQKENTFVFDQYLVVQLDNLSNICAIELSSKIDINTIKKYLIKPYGWIRLARQSSIFNDYYTIFKQDKNMYSKLFSQFLKNIGKNI